MSRSPFSHLDDPQPLPPTRKPKAASQGWGVRVAVALAFLGVAAPLWGSWLFSGGKPALVVSRKEYGRLLAFEFDADTKDDKYHWQTADGEVVEKTILKLGEKLTGKPIGWVQLYTYLGKQGWKLVSVAVHPQRGMTFKEYIFEREG